MVKIIEYADKYHEAFRQLNRIWLDKYNLTETADLVVLDDPRGTILNQGGFIWLAIENEEIVGTAALLKEGKEYELAKMAVAPSSQGRGISKLLLDSCLLKAREEGGKKIVLFSNHQLITALKLYERYGFQYVEVKDSPFKTADVKMELTL